MERAGRIDRRAGLDRAAVIEASFAVVQADGLDRLSMRSLAERLGVKAASLYWHVRDRRELIELLGRAVLDEIPVPAGSLTWRELAERTCESLAATLARRRDSARVVLDVPEVLDGSAIASRLAGALAAAGLPRGEAAHAARALMLLVVAGAVAPAPGGRSTSEAMPPATVVIVNGSRGVLLRAGLAPDGLAASSRESVAGASVSVSGTTVSVRRLRGTRHAEVALDPRRPWSVRVQGGTWNSRLDLAGIDLRELQLDGGAARVECFLPGPRGIVPIGVSGGAIGVRLHRPPGTAATARISAGALQVSLDAFSTRAAVLDSRWESAGASASGDRYELKVSGAAVQVSLDALAPGGMPASAASPAGDPGVASGVTTGAAPGVDDGRFGGASTGVELLLLGIERRIAARG